MSQRFVIEKKFICISPTRGLVESFRIIDTTSGEIVGVQSSEAAAQEYIDWRHKCERDAAN